MQSSCNLTKQMQAKKAKKSLNIIHIGNICERPFRLPERPFRLHATLPMHTSPRLPSCHRRAN